MTITDDDIRNAVINLYKRYDKDNSGYIDRKQIPRLVSDLTRQLSYKRQYSKDTLDYNQDGKVTKDELFVLMRKIND